MFVELGHGVQAARAHLADGRALVEQQVEQVDDLLRGRGRIRARVDDEEGYRARARVRVGVGVGVRARVRARVGVGVGVGVGVRVGGRAVDDQLRLAEQRLARLGRLQEAVELGVIAR